MQTESCSFIIIGVIVKDEENANYYPARRYIESLTEKLIAISIQAKLLLNFLFT